MPRALPARDDSGVTLVELVVALMITSLLAVVIAAAFSVGVKTTDAANDRLAGSQGALITTSMFPADVQSSVAAVTLGATPCSGATPTVATMSWTDPDATPTPVSASYSCPVSGAQRNLTRTYVSAGVSTTSVLAYDVTSAVVTCAPNCTTPTSVTIAVTESGGYSFSVTGSRRDP